MGSEGNGAGERIQLAGPAIFFTTRLRAVPEPYPASQPRIHADTRPA
jgi:hypothetical protein